MNYNTSKDYELLCKLLNEGQSIVCFDINKTPCVAKKSTKITTCYVVYAHLKDLICVTSEKVFTQRCDENNIEFILPNAWISVKDRLPEKYTSVLTFSGAIDANYIINDGKWILEKSVTHWQHLPESPKN